MPNKPNKLGQFWQELKRRRVIHVITVYATSSFVIIELVNNLADTLNLPEKLPIIIVIVLAAGFPLAVVLSWIYDLTSEGMERTKPLSEIPEGEKPAVPNAWKIATYVSFVVIIGLVVLNVMGRNKQLRPGDIQSLVILPFNNYTGDETLDYFVSGMHFSLIGDIGKLGGLKVITKTTSDGYKDVDMSVPQIASELNVDALAEVAVMCLGEDSLCIQFILNTAAEEPIWIADYKEEKSQILNLYSRVTKIIADEVMVELTADEKRLFDKDRTVDKKAYEAYLKGYQYWERLGKEDLEQAMEYYQLAIDIDPDWAPPYAGMAYFWMAMAQMGYVAPDIALPKIYEYLYKSFEIDPDHPDAHYHKAQVSFNVEWNWEEAEKEFLKALAINPNDAMARTYYAQLLIILQRPDEALGQGQLAVELDPLNPLIQAAHAIILMDLDNWKASFEYCEKALALDPQNIVANLAMEEVAYHFKYYDKVMEVWKVLLPLQEGIEKIYNELGIQAALEESVRQMEFRAQNSFVSPISIAQWNNRLYRHDKAMDWLEESFEIREQFLPYIVTGLLRFDSLYNNPRFIDIVEKMNLPMPGD